MFCEDCGEVYLRKSSHQCGDARVDPSPDAGAQPVMTDGGVVVETARCYGCKESVPESDLEQVPSGATYTDEKIVEHRTRDPVTGERRDDVRRVEREHTIPKCSNCRGDGDE